MTPQTQLHQRATRMLYDGLKHAPTAIEWARMTVATPRTVEQMRGHGFTLRELSLGAGQ